MKTHPQSPIQPFEIFLIDMRNYTRTTQGVFRVVTTTRETSPRKFQLWHELGGKYEDPKHSTTWNGGNSL